MRYFAFLFIILGLLMPSASQACRGLILPDEDAQKLIDEAYFVGMVRGSYIQQFPSGDLKEAGLKPFAVYAAAPDMNLQEPIIVMGRGAWTSCDAYVPKQNEFAEVMIVKDDGKLMLRRLDFFVPEFMDKLRQKMRYVGEE